MLKKISVLICVSISLCGSAHKKRRFDQIASSLSSHNGASADSAAAPAVKQPDNALEFVSHIKPIQEIILGYLDKWQNQIINTPHANTMRVVVYSPDGKYLASAGDYDHVVKLWNPETNQVVAELSGAESWIYALAFSSDNKYLVGGTGDSNNSVLLWDLLTYKLVKKLPVKNDHVSICFTPDNKKIVACALDKFINIWDLQNNFKFITADLGCRAGALACAPKCDYFACGGYDGAIQLWDSKTVQCIDKLLPAAGHHVLENGHVFAAAVSALAYSPDGNYLIAAYSHGEPRIRVWDTKTKKVHKELSGHTRVVRSIAYSPDSNFFATGSEDNSVKLWDSTQFEQLDSLEVDAEFPGTVPACSISPVTYRLAVAGRYNLILWLNQALQLGYKLKAQAKTAVIKEAD